MRRGGTLGENRWPEAPEFVQAAERLQANARSILLRAIWDGFDRLRAEVLTAFDPSVVDEEIERSITQYLTPQIRRSLPQPSPYEVEQGWYEFATRLPAPAQPPLYDIAFVLRSNERVALPLEAKVLRTHGAVADYVHDLKEQFLTCRYAPFSSEGAMIGYLLSGDPAKALENIASKGEIILEVTGDFPTRPYRWSRHRRYPPPGMKSPVEFGCHHFIFAIA